MTINHKKENFSRLEISNKNRVPIIFSSPHSGKKFTNEFLEEINCSPSNLFFLEDKYVDELYKGSSTYGISKIDAIISRAVIDLNRSLSDLDHNLIENVPSIILDSIKTSYPSKYVRSGIGLIPKINQFDKEIYSKKINWKLIKDRIDKLYTPWHTSLKRMIDETIFSISDEVTRVGLAGANIELTRNDIGDDVGARVGICFPSSLKYRFRECAK